MFQSLLFSNLQNEKDKNRFSEILKFVNENKTNKKMYFRIFYLNILMNFFIMMLSPLKFIQAVVLKKGLNLEHCCLSLQRELTLSVLIEDRLTLLTLLLKYR